MKKIKNKILYVYAAIIYVIFALVAWVLSSIYLETDMKSFFINRYSAAQTGSSDIIEVVIDDISINKYPWPWSKNMYSELFDYFDTYAKPKVIGFDILVTNINPMNKADIDFVKKVSMMKNLVAGFSPAMGDNDDSTVEYMKTFRDKYSLNVDYKAYELNPEYFSVEKISNLYLEAANNLASVKINREMTTGTVFNSINVIKIGESYYPSLPFKMYLLENDTNDIIIDDDNIIVPKTGLRFAHTLITKPMVYSPIKFYENLYSVINGKHLKEDYTHYWIPASRIIDSYRNLKNGTPKETDLNPEMFNGKTIFIGANISGPSADVLRTPKGTRHPGVDIQATVYDNLVNNQFLTNAWQTSIFAALFIALLSFVFILRFSFIQSLLLILFTDVLYFATVAYLASNNYILSFINAIVVQLVTLIFGYSFKFITENRNKEKIKQAMGKYLSQDIMKNVVSNIDDLKLGGKRAVVTVLFSDIRGFTSLSEKMSAEEVSMILNEYFSEMEPIITKYNGVINKFIGDAVMAIFGEPIQDANHAQNAVKCAYEMLKTLEYLREKWLLEGKPKIEIGIGINTGEVFIGNIGTENRMEYTVIGDTVNLASRIESYNKAYKTNLLVSPSTFAAIENIADVIKINEVQIRGKAKKMNIYEVLRIDLNKD